MRFEEWKKTQDDQFLCARHVWEAAQKIEREACLAGVRGVMVTDNSRSTWKRCIKAIEMRSNDQVVRAALAAPNERRVMRLVAMEIDMSKEETPQYFYKVDGCPAQTAHDADCICWHDDGAGPFPDERPDDPDTLKEWRFKPHNA